MDEKCLRKVEKFWILDHCPEKITIVLNGFKIDGILFFHFEAGGVLLISRLRKNVKKGKASALPLLIDIILCYIGSTFENFRLRSVDAGLRSPIFMGFFVCL